jgi:filamentous hemagglutinin
LTIQAAADTQGFAAHRAIVARGDDLEAEAVNERIKANNGPAGMEPLDMLQLELCAAGVVDPTPICDFLNAGVSLMRGNYGDAALNVGAGLLPYAGDAVFKGMKLAGRVITKADEGVKLAKGVEKGAQFTEKVGKTEKTVEAAVEAAPNGEKVAGAAGAAPSNLGRIATKTEIDPNKFKYIFGEVASSEHNAARSLQNAAQMNRVGISNTAQGRQILTQALEKAAKEPSNVTRTFTRTVGDAVQTFEVRESLFSGPGGFLKLESTWEVLADGTRRLTTVIPFGG